MYPIIPAIAKFYYATSADALVVAGSIISLVIQQVFAARAAKEARAEAKEKAEREHAWAQEEKRQSAQLAADRHDEIIQMLSRYIPALRSTAAYKQDAAEALARHRELVSLLSVYNAARATP